jgi:hypothetical protein
VTHHQLFQERRRDVYGNNSILLTGPTPVVPQCYLAYQSDMFSPFLHFIVLLFIVHNIVLVYFESALNRESYLPNLEILA